MNIRNFVQRVTMNKRSIDLFVYDPNPPKLSHRPKSLMCINRQENQTLAFKS